MFCVAATARAQFLYPPPVSPYIVPPSIRTTPFIPYPGVLPAPLPVPVPPAPVVRSANQLITLWNTVGTASALIIYNPTLLIGTAAAPVTPSPLLSLIAGQLIAPFGHSALSTSNPAFYNYLVNTFLLPTGLSLFLF